MIDSGISQAKVFTDFGGLNRLKADASHDKLSALPEVARQFESIFLSMVMKSMRDANAVFSKDGLLNSQTTEYYQDMFDQQLAITLTQGRGTGLADVIVKQLSPNSTKDSSADNTIKPINFVEQMKNITQTKFTDAESFVKEIWPVAKQVAKKLLVDPKLLVAQAVLETGWGKGIIHNDNGQSSFNLFNIKADPSWQKQAVAKKTIEFEGGVATTKVDPFRSYQSFSESFHDYFNFLQTNPRYQQALQVVGEPQRFIEELQSAGYATDPNYAQKVLGIYQSSRLGELVDQLK